MISLNDNDFVLTNNILSQVKWRNLYNNMPTIFENKIEENNKSKREHIFIKNLRLKNDMEKKKKNFYLENLKDVKLMMKRLKMFQII